MKQRIRVCAYRVACFVLAALFVAGGAAWLGAGAISTVHAQGGPTLTSDKSDYQPGDIVTLTGTGFQPGENVTIVISVDPVTHAPDTLAAVADANGNFTNSSYIVQESDLGVTFTAVATGDQGSMAQTTFTDSYPSGRFTLHVGPVATGNAINVSPSGTFTGNTCAAATRASASNVGTGTNALTLTAVAGTGFVFSSWTVSSTGTTTTCNGSLTASPCVINVPGGGGNTITVTANFALTASYNHQGFRADQHPGERHISSDSDHQQRQRCDDDGRGCQRYVPSGDASRLPHRAPRIPAVEHSLRRQATLQSA